jgi:hypothetical protein
VAARRHAETRELARDVAIARRERFQITGETEPGHGVAVAEPRRARHLT